MKTYDKYKDSGVEWIGEIPEHWEVRRLKTDTFLKGRIGWNGLRSDEFKELSYAYLVTGQDFTGPNINWDRCYQIERNRYDEDPFIQLENGDILITKDGTIGKISKVSNMDKPACLNSGIFVMKQKKTHIYEQGFIYWMLTSSLLKEYNKYTSTGTTILHLYQNVFENMPLLIPPISEQQSIATYLDKKCAEVDKVIATQQRRIELLQELKQSTITNAVTRGLNPNVEMKDSGVKWIGEVPEHWEIRKLKYSCRKEPYFIKTGPFGSQLKGEDLKDIGDVRVYNQRNVIDSSFSQVKYFVTNKKAKTLKSFYTKPSDILVTSRGTIGKAAIIPDSVEMGILHPCLIAVRNSNKIIIRNYLLYYINDFDGFKINVEVESNATTIEVIYTETLKNIRLTVPPLIEQEAIVSYLDKKCAELDSSILKTQKEVELLQEYKQSLITEVVTGKRRVC